MFSTIGKIIRKPVAVLLGLIVLCMVVTSCAETETIDPDLLFGEEKNGTYENGFLGIGCTLDGWHFYSDEETAAINQKAKDVLSKEIAGLMDQNITLMAAEEQSGLQNVNIQIRNVQDYLSVYDALGLQYIAENSLDSFRSSLESAGFTDVRVSTGERSIGEQNFASIKGEYLLNSIQMYFEQLWTIQGNYLVYITGTTVLEDQRDALFSRFFLLQ